MKAARRSEKALALGYRCLRQAEEKKIGVQ